jgi:hypothetical protein
MGNLRPIGSEKLQGMDKINRIMEIARYKENRPNPINEDKSTEFSKKLSDGKTYRIDKEKNGYVIKRTINESTETFDYLEPMKNRKYYSSYSQAFKRLNLVVKEVNMSQGHQRNVSLFTESVLDKELEEKRYYLNLGKKTEEKEQAPVDAAPAPAPAPVAAPAPAPTEEPSADLSGLDDMDLGAEVDTEEEGDEEEKVTLKVIQKFTGKLAQKIRAFGGDEEDEELSSKDIKYVINSILSALDLDSLDEEDREEIMDKIEGVEEDEFGGSDEEGMGDEEDMGDEEVVEPEAEMAEGHDDFDTRDHFDDYDPKKFKRFPKNLDFSNLEDDSLSLDKFHTKFGKKRDDDYENDFEDLYEEDDEISKDDIDSIFDEVTENEIGVPERVKTPERTRERETEREVERERRRKDRDDPFRPGKRPEERPAPRAGRDNEYDKLSSSAPRRHRINHKDIGKDEASQLEDMFEGMFTESKVDDVLKKYFKLESREKNILKEQKDNSTKVRNSSVNVVQEMVSMKVLKKYPNAKFLGKTKNNNLVFEHKNKQFRITPKGGIL